MSNDFVQIGSFIISKVVFDFLMIVLSVITGGLVTYFTTQRLETQKWKQQKKDKQQEHYREALALALDWIAPIDSALIRIQSLSSAFIRKTITLGDFQEQWPNLLHELSRIDKAIPAKLKVLLPIDVYDGMEIVNNIHELYIYLLSTDPPAKKSNDKFIERLRNASHQISIIKKLFEDYKDMLISEYKKTYE